jgi:alkanesulfonate monooxygenase SsuD/methylene tetrahydromethanopterin reductase-like flavin-dependent oxidoreductase (luciferase family)
LGRNAVEYEALGKNFRDRGARCEEQVALLRRLWSEQSVTHDGVSERVTGAGLAPDPIQRPIPIWFGGASTPAYRRAGRLGDGWFPVVPPGPELDQAKSVVEAAAIEAGRDPAALGMHAQASWGSTGVDAIAQSAASWRTAGATHLSVNTMNAGFGSVDKHLAALAAAADAFGLS